MEITIDRRHYFPAIFTCFGEFWLEFLVEMGSYDLILPLPGRLAGSAATGQQRAADSCNENQSR